jgi:hypothetical protein
MRRKWVLFKASWLPWSHAYRYRRAKYGGKFGRPPW